MEYDISRVAVLKSKKCDLCKAAKPAWQFERFPTNDDTDSGGYEGIAVCEPCAVDALIDGLAEPGSGRALAGLLVEMRHVLDSLERDHPYDARERLAEILRLHDEWETARAD